MKRFLILIVLSGLLFFPISSCKEDSSETAVDSATLNVKLVDAPITLGSQVVEEVNITVTRVDVVKKGSTEENSSQIKDGDGVSTVMETDIRLNLLDYQNGVEALLGTVTLETGEYLQLRFIVDLSDDANKPTIKFENDDTLYALQIPSGATSGIKLKGNAHNPLFVLADGENVDLVFDFDAQASIIVPPSESKSDFILRPVIKEVKFRNQVLTDVSCDGSDCP